MKLQWNGEGSLRLQEKGQRVLLGVSHVAVGRQMPKFKDKDLLFLEHQRTEYAQDVQQKLEKSSAFVIDGAGEYSYQGVTSRVKAVRKENGDSTHLISLNFANIMCVSISDIDRELENTEIDFIGTPDVLFIPVGGSGVLDHKQAVKTINIVQPRVVIPTYYVHSGLETEQGSLNAFIQEYAVVNTEPYENLTLKPNDLPSGTTQTYLLDLSG